jgi:hypothetical protein
MDGLVSTGKSNSLHNIKKTFHLHKKKMKEFYSQFLGECGLAKGFSTLPKANRAFKKSKNQNHHPLKH